MRKLTIMMCYGPIFGIGLYLVCISPACSQANKEGTGLHQIAQGSVKKQKVIESTPEQEQTHLEHDKKSVQKKETIESKSEEEPTDLEPVSDKITEPKAKITAPDRVNVKSYVVLDFSGTISSIEPDFDVVLRPEGSTSSVTKLYDKNRSLIYGLFIPEKTGKYRVVLVAFATNGGKADTVRSYAFVDIDVSDLGKPPEPDHKPPGPLPSPPGPEPPLPAPPGPTPPQPKKEDTYGMYAYTKDLLSQMPPGDPWQSRIPLIYDSFDKMIAQSSSFTDATKFVQATSDLYKSALGKDYNYFSYYFFTPLKTQLGKINNSGKLPSTVDAHVEAWREISKALHEVKPVASSVRSHK